MRKNIFKQYGEEFCKKIVCLQVNPYMTKTEINILIKKLFNINVKLEKKK